MNSLPLERSEFIQHLVDGLTPISIISACWESGSAGSGNVDQYSDIDLRLLVEDACVDQAFSEEELRIQSAYASNSL